MSLWRTGSQLLLAAWLAAGSAVAQDDDDDPFAPRFDLKAARGLLAAGDYQAAVDLSSDAIKAGWRSSGWQQVLVRGLVATGAYDQAGQEALNLANAHSRDLPSLLLAHATLKRTGDAERAGNILDFVNRFASATGTDMDDFDASELIALGEAALLMGGEPKFVLDRFFETARRRSPKIASGHHAAANLALDKHDYALAAQVAEEGVRQCGESAEFAFLLARAFLPSDGERAREHIARALELNPHHFPTLLLVAEEALDGDDYGGAVEAIDEILSINAKHAPALALKSAIAYLEDDFEQHANLRSSALEYWSENPVVDHTIGTAISRKRRFTEGRLFQKSALKASDGHLPSLLALAMDELRLGNEAEAWRIVERLHDEDPYNHLAFNLITLRDRLEKFATRETEHFVLRMTPIEMEIYGDRALEILEEARQILGGKYGLETETKTLVEFFPEQQDFAIRTFGVPGGQGILGACFGSVVTMNSPGGDGSLASNWEATLWHEYCHVVTLTRTNNRMPRWFSEGISVYEERLRDARWGMEMSPEWRARILGTGSPSDPMTAEKGMVPMLEIPRLFSHPDSVDDIMFGYFLSSMAIEHLVDAHGEEALRTTIDLLGSGKDISTALGQATGSVEDLSASFDAFVAASAESHAPDADWKAPDLEHPARTSLAAAEAYLNDHPNSIWALTTVTSGLIGEGETERAKALAERLHELNPTDASQASGLAQLARIHKVEGDLEAEKATLLRLVERSGDAEFAFSRLQDLHVAAGDWPAAAAAAEMQFAVNPMLSRTHSCFAHANLKNGNPLAAAASYRRALKLGVANESEARLGLARSLLQTGAADEARSQTIRALALSPRFLDGQQLLLEIENQ